MTKAVILAAGKGARMGALTTDVPKPMMEVGGRPILERIVTGLAAAGIRKFLIVTGHRAETIRSYFGDGKPWKVAISYAQQARQDGTGRVVELARDWTGRAPFLLSYGDILVADTTYRDLLSEWKQQRWDGMLTVKLGENLRHGGVAIFNDEFCLQELVEKPGAAELEVLRARFGDFKPWYNAGVYVFTPRVFEYTARLRPSVRGEYELTDAIRQMAGDGLRFKGRVIEDLWIDVRDPAALADANARLRPESISPRQSLRRSAGRGYGVAKARLSGGK